MTHKERRAQWDVWCKEYAEGSTPTEIANKHGITRQYVHKIILKVPGSRRRKVLHHLSRARLISDSA